MILSPWNGPFCPHRKIGVFLRRFEEIRTDVPALIDEWASRFFEVWLEQLVELKPWTCSLRPWD